MADKKCNPIGLAKSFAPGSKDDADGEYCLLKFRDKKEEACKCIAQVENYTFESGKKPPCITIDDGEWTSYQWVRKCDASVSGSLWLYDVEAHDVSPTAQRS
jgi:hypothetical protein